ncbi:TNT domain-containing protein [Amycolatopsis sp. K13G38]|uniref:TNT domain-containing protein n=1 Tax=Amycolatopsis acididurans TaxID=2724524 RepID=A0ABX1JKI6_9PSEU|nr:TNT domain-containing protein [Amycolatopsis acididurans]NKQ59334.1 TNT domain-containing protein [Amycolatopsis acididurans]
MGIELPKELADVAAETGLSWPQADEDKMREQAAAWRDAHGKLTALAGEADKVAGGAIGAMTGPSAEAASKKWSGFVHPDNGHLTAAAAGAGDAADRLEHAAEQVGTAKVEMVRQLVDAAKNRDAAQAAASAGHPTALLGLDTVLRGTATNLSSLTQGLAGAVGPGGGAVSTLGNVVDPNPGARTEHGQGGLLSTVTGLPGHLVSAVDSTVGATTGPDGPLGSHGPLGSNGPLGSDGPLGEHSPLGDHGPLGDQGPLGGLPQVSGPPAADAPPAHDLPTPPQGQPALPVAGQSAGGQPTPFHPDPSAAGTGPIQVPQAPAHYGGLLQSGGFDDVPTPPSGIPPVHSGTVASGFTDAAYSPPPQAPAAPPPVAPPAPAQQPGYVAPPPYAASAPPPMAPGAAPPPPAAGYAPRQAPPVLAPGGYVQRQPGMPYPAQSYAPQQPQQPQPSPQDRPPRQDLPPKDLPPLGAPRRERESVVALFLVHMFPLGHLPVAADKPARQLPVPPPEVDYAPGLRFPPHDHPESGRFDSSGALEKVRDGYARLPTPPGEPPEELFTGHDPLGGSHERDWDRRFLAGMRDEIPEYAWPPGERYPEGGHERGEPDLLAEGTMLDRFGDIGGRVFAPLGTSFAQRSLPPSAKDAGYRRYQVLCELPMWSAVSAPWFGQPGGGVRYRSVYSADELVTMGYLEDVTFEEGE